MLFNSHGDICVSPAKEFMFISLLLPRLFFLLEGKRQLQSRTKTRKILHSVDESLVTTRQGPTTYNVIKNVVSSQPYFILDILSLNRDWTSRKEMFCHRI
jgi:hypothetical protein